MSIDSQTTVANRHDFEYTFTNEYDKNQTAKTIITPTTGKRIKVTGVSLSTEGASTAGQKVRIYFATSADTVATIYCTNAVQNTKVDPIVVTGGVNEPVKITSNLGDDQNYYIAVNYKEV
jgi:hypothetical protein